MERQFTQTHNVLSNPYLLEMVLVALLMRDLMRASQVSKDWNRLVKRSHQLQRQLLLRADKSDQQVIIMFEPESCGLCYAALVLPPESLLNTSTETSRSPNPMFVTDSIPSCNPEYHDELLPEGIAFHQMMRSSAPEASWRHMYISQPPPQSATISLYYNVWSSFKIEARFEVVAKDGITFGDIAAEFAATSEAQELEEWLRDESSNDTRDDLRETFRILADDTYFLNPWLMDIEGAECGCGRQNRSQLSRYT
ncbi:hypothetical protein BDZ85DRAFT_268617 [Elsinoe ampelina]|uniref:F-box domain-containing protein n=1 Tax=Elsinoe ampelina TaxID=302913 RepID=A0A6A6G1R4_9PEZI|nr:hypothetical protein BDZ85DRAFT_268617 [Elsinoe ampelina]